MIFIDAGPFVGRFYQPDQWYRAAHAAWLELERRPTKCFTSSLVLAEAVTFLGRRAGFRFAAERARSLFSSPSLEILRPSVEDELEAAEWMEKYADQRIGFVDCVSFALMKRAGIKRVFTFDKHFARAGFEVWPRR